MTPRTIVVMIAALAVAGVVVKIGLLGEAPALSSAVVKREGLPSDATQMPPMESATELLDDYDLVHAVEHAGVGNLVIALHDGAMLPLVDEEVEIRGAWREAGEARAHTDHRGEVAFEGIVEGGYLYTVQVAGGPLLIASAPVYVQPDETTLLRLQVRDYDHVIGGRVLDRQGAPVAGLKITAKALRLASVTDGPKLRRDSTASTHADDDGLFEIAGLRAGDYEISIEADEHYGAASVTVRAGVDSAVLTVAARRMMLGSSNSPSCGRK